jgi:hypothetical protein
LRCSDQIDLKGINYNSSSFAESYKPNTNTLSVSDGTNSTSLNWSRLSEQKFQPCDSKPAFKPENDSQQSDCRLIYVVMKCLFGAGSCVARRRRPVTADRSLLFRFVGVGKVGDGQIDFG